MENYTEHFTVIRRHFLFFTARVMLVMPELITGTNHNSLACFYLTADQFVLNPFAFSRISSARLLWVLVHS